MLSKRKKWVKVGNEKTGEGLSFSFTNQEEAS